MFHGFCNELILYDKLKDKKEREKRTPKHKYKSIKRERERDYTHEET